MAQRTPNADTQQTQKASGSLEDVIAFAEESSSDMERRRQRRKERIKARAAEVARQLEEEQAAPSEEQAEQETGEQTPAASEGNARDKVDETEPAETEEQAGRRSKKKAGKGHGRKKGPVAEGSVSIVKDLKAVFDTRTGQFKSLLEEWKHADSEANIVGAMRAELHASNLLLDAEQARQRGLEKLEKKAKGGPKEHLQFLQDAIDDCKSNITKLQKKIASIEHHLTRADAKLQKAFERREDALASLTKADGAVLGAVMSSLKKVAEAKPGAAKPEVRRDPGAGTGVPTDGGRDILRLQRRNGVLDPREVRAIDAVVARAKTGRSEVIDDLRALGLATRIEAVIRAIDRRRLSDVRREILDKMLPTMLDELMDDEPEFRKSTRDPVGFADDLINRLDKPKGPVALVTNELADLVIKERGLAASNKKDLVSYLKRRFEEPRA